MVLVFGGDGFIGGYLRQLPGFSGCGEDVTQAIDPDGVWHGVEAVVNLACLQPARGNFSLQQYIEVNNIGLCNVLNFARAAGVNKALCVVCQKTIVTGETGKLVITDQTAINVMERYRQEYGMQTVVLRIPPAFGPGPFIKGYGLGVFLERAAKGEAIEVWGDPDVKRDIISVHDVVTAIQMLVGRRDTQGPYELWGIPLSLREEVETVNEVYANTTHIVYKRDKPNGLEPLPPEPYSEDLWQYLRAEKVHIRSLESHLYKERMKGLGWHPKWTFKDIVEELKGAPETWK